MTFAAQTARLSALLGLPPEQPSDDGAEELLGRAPAVVEGVGTVSMHEPTSWERG